MTATRKGFVEAVMTHKICKTEEKKMVEGKIKWFNAKKGFGFIAGDDGDDYFMHQSQIPEGAKLVENTRVSFEVKETERGKQAQSVQVV